MKDRFEVLLAKARAKRLSPAETEELARLLNKPLLDAIENPPAGFVSKHVFAPSDVASRIRAIDWFGSLGEPLTIDLTMPVTRVTSWEDATESCRDVVWENAQLEARNQLTLWMHQHDRENYQRWNEFVVTLKAEVVTPLSETILKPYQHRHGLDDAIVHSVRSDVLGALMENVYLGSGHSSFFFLELLWVYEAGHLPCGWRGEWPAGSLLVY